MKRHCGGWPIPFAVRLHSHAELSETPTAPAPRCCSPLVCSQTLPTRTGTRHDPPCRPPLVCSQTQACFRRSKPEIGLTLARPGSVRLLLHGRGTCPIRQPSQAHWRVIVALWSIAVRAAKRRECQAHWRVILTPWSIAVRAAKHGRSGQAHWRVIVAPVRAAKLAGVPGALRVIVAPWASRRAAKLAECQAIGGYRGAVGIAARAPVGVPGHWRVIVAPWGIAARAAKLAGVPGALAGNRGAVGHRSPSGGTWQECQAHLRVMVAMWGIAASSRVV
jgi:hypothetical protein